MRTWTNVRTVLDDEESLCYQFRGAELSYERNADKEASQTRDSAACAGSGQAPWSRAACLGTSRDEKRLPWDEKVAFLQIVYIG